MENPVGVLDFETDPFVYGRVPYPFAACILTDAGRLIFWEPKVIKSIVQFLKTMPPHTLFAHNGGKFDFHFLIECANPQKILIRNGRIVQMKIGNVTLKDSYPLIPFALEKYKKTKINYEIFEKERRNIPRNRKKITDYLIDDCENLLELVTGFKKIVGHKDTIGAAAFNQMKKMGIKILRLNEAHDTLFRPYFFGGRVQAFQHGIFKGPLQYVDINSAYSYAMTFDHPSGKNYIARKKLPIMRLLGPQFIHCIADSNGALPQRTKTGLDFPIINEGEFYATGWEIKSGLETKTIVIKKIINVWEPVNRISLNIFVNKFFKLRDQARKNGDEVSRLAYKNLLNSGYGKFAQNPRNFREYRLQEFGVDVPGFEHESDFGAISIWSKSSYDGTGFYDVATAASITGFVRAYLWRSICASKNVLYADTDSMLCRAAKVHIGEKLGQWKDEGKIICAAIAGKKLFALKWKRPKNGEKYRIASKGARLTFREICKLCEGKKITWRNPAPTFSIKGTEFIERIIRKT